MVARKLYDAFNAPRANPAVLPAGAPCLDTQNARDAQLSGTGVNFFMARDVVVKSTDPALTVVLDVVP